MTKQEFVDMHILALSVLFTQCFCQRVGREGGAGGRIFFLQLVNEGLCHDSSPVEQVVERLSTR